MLLICSKKRL